MQPRTLPTHEKSKKITSEKIQDFFTPALWEGRYKEREKAMNRGVR